MQIDVFQTIEQHPLLFFPCIYVKTDQCWPRTRFNIIVNLLSIFLVLNHNGDSVNTEKTRGCKRSIGKKCGEKWNEYVEKSQPK